MFPSPFQLFNNLYIGWFLFYIQPFFFWINGVILFIQKADIVCYKTSAQITFTECKVNFTTKQTYTKLYQLHYKSQLQHNCLFTSSTAIFVKPVNLIRTTSLILSNNCSGFSVRSLCNLLFLSLHTKYMKVFQAILNTIEIRALPLILCISYNT